jgi:RNA polymerase sigma factor (sigma-70 family)
MDIDLNACASGDQDAWRQFIDQTAALVHAAVRRTAGPQLREPHTPDIDDLVQAVYLRLLKNDCRLLLNYDPGRAAISTWLTLIARSVTIDALRRKAHPTLPLQDMDQPHTTPRTPQTAANELGDVAPLHLLTERQALVLRMLFEDGRSVAEVARILNVGDQTVRSTKHKALERLRAHFNAEMDEQ